MNENTLSIQVEDGIGAQDVVGPLPQPKPEVEKPSE